MIKAETFANGDIYIHGYREDGSPIAFAPVPGYSGRYLASEDGEIFSLWWSGKVTKLSPSISHGYLQVTLCLNGQSKTRRVHQLVLEAFVGLREPGQIGLHANDISDDNRLSNLRWGTHKENAADSILNGRRHNLHLNQCKHGHEFTHENTYINPSRGVRQCRTCRSGWENNYQDTGLRAAAKARYVEKKVAA